jgi:serine/threonine-protein kinase
MLTGTLPFEAEGALAMAMKHVTEEPIPPRERDPHVPEVMEALVMGLLAKDPEDRHGSAAELAEDLRLVRAVLPLAFVAGSAGHPDTQQAKARADGGAHSEDPEREPRRRKRPMAIGLVALAALLALGTFGWSLTGSREGPNKSVGAVAAPEGGQEGGAPAAPEGSEDAQEGVSGMGLGSALPAVKLAGGRYVPASASATPSASASPSASTSASPSASAPASASATPEGQTSDPVASGPWASAPQAQGPSGTAPSASVSPALGGSSGSGGQDAGTTNTVDVESAAQEQYR